MNHSSTSHRSPESKFQSDALGVASPREPAPQAATAVQAPAQAAPAPHPAGGPTQQASGLSGPIQPTGPDTSSPKGTTFGNSDLAADGRDMKPNSTSRQSAAVPPPETASQGKGPAPKVPSEPATSPIPYSLRPSMEQVHKAEAAALSEDLSRCRSATQDMRRAGVKCPIVYLPSQLWTLDFSTQERSSKQSPPG